MEEKFADLDADHLRWTSQLISNLIPTIRRSATADDDDGRQAHDPHHGISIRKTMSVAHQKIWTILYIGRVA